MDERFDVEAVLRDLLDVLRQHNIPIETAALNVSLLDAAFDELIPQLRTYRAGHLHRTMVIDDVPMTFRAQRRYPFAEIVQVLESEFRPRVETFAQTLQREHPDLKIDFVTTNASQPSEWPLYAYQLGIHCQFSDDAHADYNQLDFSIWLQQREATTYPQLYARIGWLVDEESGGDWGLHAVYSTMVRGLDYAAHELGSLRGQLSSYFERFRKEIARKLSGDLADFGE